MWRMSVLFLLKAEIQSRMKKINV